jgi:hypothetical protein
MAMATVAAAFRFFPPPVPGRFFPGLSQLFRTSLAIHQIKHQDTRTIGEIDDVHLYFQTIGQTPLMVS